MAGTPGKQQISILPEKPWAAIIYTGPFVWGQIRTGSELSVGLLYEEEDDLRTVKVHARRGSVTVVSADRSIENFPNTPYQSLSPKRLRTLAETKGLDRILEKLRTQ